MPKVRKIEDICKHCEVCNIYVRTQFYTSHLRRLKNKNGECRKAIKKVFNWLIVLLIIELSHTQLARPNLKNFNGFIDDVDEKFTRLNNTVIENHGSIKRHVTLFATSILETQEVKELKTQEIGF